MFICILIQKHIDFFCIYNPYQLRLDHTNFDHINQFYINFHNILYYFLYHLNNFPILIIVFIHIRKIHPNAFFQFIVHYILFVIIKNTKLFCFLFI